jgi:hypothetical protein
MVISFSTNPYNNYYAANSKEFISLDKAAKQGIRTETRYALLPGNADSFAANLEKYSKQFGYGQVDATDANVLTYSNQIHMLETWNRVTDEDVAINANEIWGTRNWTRGAINNQQIAEMTATRGEVGTAQAVTLIGRKKFLERWKSTILSHQIMQLLTPEAQIAIKINKKKYQWTDPLTEETINESHSLLNEVLRQHSEVFGSCATKEMADRH